MSIKISEFKKVQDYLESIEQISIDEIEIEGIEISDNVREEWKMTGLNIRYFLEMIIDEYENGVNPLNTIWDAENEN